VKKRADDDDISAKNYNSVARAITKQLMIFGAGAGPRPLRPAPPPLAAFVSVNGYFGYEMLTFFFLSGWVLYDFVLSHGEAFSVFIFIACWADSFVRFFRVSYFLFIFSWSNSHNWPIFLINMHQ